MPTDASIPLGIKPPDTMQNLSSLLSVAKGAQDVQAGGIALREKQGLQQYMSDPSNFTDKDGNVDFNAAMRGVMRVAPTTGLPVVQNLLAAQKAHVEATSALNNLGDDNRTRVANTLSTIKPDADPKLVYQALDALGRQYKGKLDPWVTLAKQGYDGAAANGPDAVADYLARASRSVLPQETQQKMNTPVVSQVDNGQRVEGINIAPGVEGQPQGSTVFSVQKQLPPNTPTIGPNNQPGYFGPQPPMQAAPPAVPGSAPGIKIPPEEQAARDRDAAGILQQENQKAQSRLAQLKADPRATPEMISAAQQDVVSSAAELNRLRQRLGQQFVPSGPVPGANESKAASVGVMNDHWAKVNAGAADNPTAMSLLSTIRELAPQAITGTEAGKKAYWNGLFNSLGLQTKASGDVQKDTDILNKAMAQLNLATPATTDAMRTLVEAGRPHSTMSAGAIKEAAQQIEGQLKANMAMRNMLTQDKRYADATGDVSHYDDKRQALEKMLDPRIYQYEAMSPDERKAFRARLTLEERTKMADKIRKLEAMGALQ